MVENKAARLILALAMAGLNILFSFINSQIISSPLFLDSLFTILSAILFGPFWGVTTGLLTNLGLEVINGYSGLFWPFAVCNMATGLIIGLMSSRGYLTKNLHLSIAVLSVALSNTILGSLIAYILFGGRSDIQIDSIATALAELGFSPFAAVFWSRIPANLFDKMISIYAAFGMSRCILLIPKRNI